LVDTSLLLPTDPSDFDLSGKTGQSPGFPKNPVIPASVVQKIRENSDQFSDHLKSVSKSLLFEG
jgi:hypothetical protein